jgi:hypothetical protein
MSVVRPEFGPTLPEMLGPRVRALPRAVRLGLLGAVALVVVVIAWATLLRGGKKELVIVNRTPIAFNFVYRAPLHKRAPQAGELARAEGGGQTFAVRELRLPPYRGDSAGVLPILASKVEDQMGGQLPGFQVRSEGRANYNKFQGYEIVYQYRPGGRLVFGRRIFLLPEPTARQGVDITARTPRSLAVPRADAVGHNGALKTSLRSFRFGTKRP